MVAPIAPLPEFDIRPLPCGYYVIVHRQTGYHWYWGYQDVLYAQATVTNMKLSWHQHVRKGCLSEDAWQPYPKHPAEICYEQRPII